MWYINIIKLKFYLKEPWQLGVSISHLITEVKQPQDWLILGWVTMLTGAIAKSV